MTSQPTAAPPLAPTRRWTLWIDGCGGFRLLSGSGWNVGGSAADAACDIVVQSDWPRKAGRLELVEGEYFWTVTGGDRQWMRSGGVLSGVPTASPKPAELILRRPSPLSRSATLSLSSSHRLVGHVDAVVLVQDTVLVGPSSDCHIRCREMTERIILLERGGAWRVKVGQREPVAMQLDQRFQHETVSLCLQAE